jgi:hypothetical protein
MDKTKDRSKNWADYYDHSDILKELLEEPVHFSLDPELQKEILAGSRAKKLGRTT